MSDGRCELRLTRRARVRRTLAPPPPSVALRTVEPERVLELAWNLDGEEPSLVRVELRAEGGGTTLVLDHRQIVATLGMRYLRIWTARLADFEQELT